MSAGRCRACDQPSLDRFLALGDIPLVNAFLTPEEIAQEKRFPLNLARCRECTLAQLEEIVPPNQLFSHYLHLSSSSAPNVEHLSTVATLLKQRLGISQQTKVLELGSN